MPTSTYCRDGQIGNNETNIEDAIDHRRLCLKCELRTREDNEVANRNDLYKNQQAAIKNGKCMKRKTGNQMLYCEQTMAALRQNCKPCYMELHRRCYDHYNPKKSTAIAQHTAPFDHADPTKYIEEYNVQWLDGQGNQQAYFQGFDLV
jgi:hypothetical protein